MFVLVSNSENALGSLIYISAPLCSGKNLISEKSVQKWLISPGLTRTNDQFISVINEPKKISLSNDFVWTFPRALPLSNSNITKKNVYQLLCKRLQPDFFCLIMTNELIFISNISLDLIPNKSTLIACISAFKIDG